MHRTVPTTKTSLAPNINSARAEKPWALITDFGMAPWEQVWIKEKSWCELTMYTFILQTRKQRVSNFPQPQLVSNSKQKKKKKSFKHLDIVVIVKNASGASCRKAVWPSGKGTGPQARNCLCDLGPLCLSVKQWGSEAS